MKLRLFAEFPGYLRRILMWRDGVNHNVEGVLVPGDPEVAPTPSGKVAQAGNTLRWKKRVLVTVASNDQPFFVAFRNAWGGGMTCHYPLTGQGFRCKLGHEQMRICVTDVNGVERPITIEVLTEEVAANYTDHDFPRI